MTKYVVVFRRGATVHRLPEKHDNTITALAVAMQVHGMLIARQKPGEPDWTYTVDMVDVPAGG